MQLGGFVFSSGKWIPKASHEASNAESSPSMTTPSTAASAVAPLPTPANATSLVTKHVPWSDVLTYGGGQQMEWRGCSEEAWAQSSKCKSDVYTKPICPKSGEPSAIWHFGRCLEGVPQANDNFRCLHPVGQQGLPCGKLLNYPEASNIWNRCALVASAMSMLWLTRTACCGSRVLYAALLACDSHMKAKHPSSWNLVNEEREKKKAESADSGTTRGGGTGGNYTSTSARGLLRMQIWAVVWCIGTLTAFATLHTTLFRSFATSLNASFRPPCMHTVRKIVRVIKSLIMVAIFQMLMSSVNFYGRRPLASASVDLWSSKHSNMGYAALDMQFGNPEFGISEATLAVAALPGTHDAQTIKTWVEESVGALNQLEGVEHTYEFTPTSLIKLAVIDDGSNIMSTFKMLSIAILYCMAHKLHLCIKKACACSPGRARTRRSAPVGPRVSSAGAPRALSSVTRRQLVRWCSCH